MPIATTTIVLTGAAVGLAGMVANRSDRILPGRKRRLVTLLRAEPPQPASDETRYSALRALDDAYQALFQNYIDPLLLGKRHDELNAIRLQYQSVEEAQAEYQVNRSIGLLLGATVTALFGTFGSPLWLGATVALSLGSSGYLFRKTYQHIVEERRLTDESINTLAFVSTLATGLYAANAITELIYYIGEKMLIVTENRARSKMIDTWAQLPRTAWLLVDDEQTKLDNGHYEAVEIALTELEPGDVIVVQAGQTVPVDGSVTAGFALVDQHMLTGEGQPIEKETGDTVYAATLVFSGSICIRVEETGLETLALQITEILNDTLSHEAQTQARARTLADSWAPLNLGLGVLAGATVGPTGMVAIWNTGIGSNVKVSAPIALLNYLNVALRSGVLIKDGRSVDLLREIDTVVFDKTGTLTLEEPRVSTIHRFTAITEDDLLTFAAAAERRQTHPIARAIQRAAEQRDLRVPHIHDAHYEIGFGIQVSVEDTVVQIGSQRYMRLNDIALSADVDTVHAQAEKEGYSLVYVALNAELVGALELVPTLRSEAAEVVAALHERGLGTYIISGDQEQPTRRLAAELGIQHYFANTLPEHKADIVERLQAEGRSVCFVGDGINDGIALKKAHVSVSMRGATTVAIDAAQILLVENDLRALPALIKLAHDYQSNMRAGYLSTIIPGLAFAGGVFGLGLGVYAALAVYNASILLSIGISMWPSVVNRNAAQQQLAASSANRPALDTARHK